MAYLHLGLLVYWVVNTVRYQLKKTEGESDNKQESTKNKTDTTPIHFQWGKIIRIEHAKIGFDSFAKSLRSNHH